MEKDNFLRMVNSHEIRILLDLSKEELSHMFGNEFSMMKNYNQNNPHHCYDLLEHTIKTVEHIECSDISDHEKFCLRVAALFHDIGKPRVAKNKDGRTVYYGHSLESAKIVEPIIRDIGLCDIDIQQICFFISHHDDFISFKLENEITDTNNPYIKLISKETVKQQIISTQNKRRLNNEYVPEIYDFILLMKLCMADAKAQSKVVFLNGIEINSRSKKCERLDAIRKIIETL